MISKTGALPPGSLVPVYLPPAQKKSPIWGIETFFYFF
jgi:hypothetical protein